MLLRDQGSSLEANLVKDVMTSPTRDNKKAYRMSDHSGATEKNDKGQQKFYKYLLKRL